MKKSELLKIMVMLACITLMLSVTSLVGRIAMMNGLSDGSVKWAMTVSLLSTGGLGMAIMVFMFIRINRKEG